MSQTTQPEFGKLRSFFWPVHGFELKKVLPMFLMFFCISFNYTILRDTKDVLVVSNIGADAIPFLKLGGTTTAAIIFMLIYAKLSNILSKEKLFYVTITPFIVFFALFPTVLYPNRELLHPTQLADSMLASLPPALGGLKALIGCFKVWTYSLFYILAELWGSAILSLLFWGFANDIMKVTEAKRFYTLLGMGANIALMVSGPYIYYVSNIRESFPVGTPDGVLWQTSLYYLMGMVVVAGITILGCYYHMNKSVLTDPRFYNPDEVKKKKSKPKMGVMESFQYLMRSKYVLCIAALVIAYGISINLVEVTWKNEVKKQFTTENDYSKFMGIFSTVTGFVTVIMMFVGGYINRRLGWGFAAMVTPVVLLVTGIGFFTFVIFREPLNPIVMQLGVTTTFMAVIIGMFQNIASKSTKYSLFDPTKEMAYIPLDQEAKVKGKAAIDVVGARLGKSGGALVNMVLIIVTAGNFALMAPFVAFTVIVTIFGWMTAVRSLDKQFVALTDEKLEGKTEDKASPATA